MPCTKCNPIKAIERAKRDARREARKSRNQAIINYCVANPEEFQRDVAAKFNITQSEVSVILRRNGYARGNRPYTRTQETRNKLRSIWTPERRAIAGAKALEQIQKFGHPKKGKHLSEEQKANISKSRMGHKMPTKTFLAIREGYNRWREQRKENALTATNS